MLCIRLIIITAIEIYWGGVFVYSSVCLLILYMWSLSLRERGREKEEEEVEEDIKCVYTLHIHIDT